MHIFIDESGTFAIPQKPAPAVTCLGAVIIPDSRRETVFAKFMALAEHWPKTPDGEIKGKLLGENQFYDAVEMFADQGVVMECAATDMGLHSKAEIEKHRDIQADKLYDSVTPGIHFNSLIAEVRSMSAELRKLSINEYMQICLMNGLVHSIMQQKVLWFAQSAPAELGAFHWQIDAKGTAISRSEALWEKLVLPMQESLSWREPLIQIHEGDYSHLDRFSSTLSADEWAERVRVHGRPAAWRELQPGLNIRMILNEDRAFLDSRKSVGLQIADVLVNLICRAMKGNVGKRAWWNLYKLMSLPPKIVKWSL
jgi:hypothetical protein